MAKFSSLQAGLLASVVLVLPAFAGDADDMIKQLLPTKAGKPVAPVEPPVLSVQAATKDEIIGRLGSDLLARSVDPKVRPRQSILLAQGHEAEALSTLRALPSMQVAVAFQGSSDALAPESGPLLGTLAEALTDTKLASYRFVIGVHTNSIGSDEYNFSLSNLRAKAIVDTLVAVHGLSKDRIFAVGFGRLVEGSGGPSEPSERIRVVNLGDTAVLTAPLNAGVSSPAVARKSSVAVDGKAHPKLSGNKASRVHVVHHRSRSDLWHAAANPHPHWAGRLRHPSAQVVSRVADRPAHRRPVGTYVDPGTGTGEHETGDSLSASWGSYDPSGSHRSNSGNGNSASGSSSASTSGASSGGAGSSGGHGWSDRRLKREISRIGTSPSGLAIYSFRYVWGGPILVGVMAQDLLISRPNAVQVGPGGYLQVNYSRIDVDMMPLGRWQAVSDALSA